MKKSRWWVHCYTVGLLLGMTMIIAGLWWRDTMLYIIGVVTGIINFYMLEKDES